MSMAGAAATTRLSDGPGDTEAAGAELAARLGAGDLVLVRGEMGTGKTTFIRGAARALGVAGPVASPTFTIGARYEGRVPVSHLDLWRLRSAEQEDPGLLDDYLTPDAIAFVEWPEVAEPELPDPSVRVEITHAGGDHRRIALRWG